MRSRGWNVCGMTRSVLDHFALCSCLWGIIAAAATTAAITAVFVAMRHLQ